MSQEFEGRQPDPLLLDHWRLFVPRAAGGPILDLACGAGHNGLFLASKGLPVVLADRSDDALAQARELAREAGLEPTFWKVDLEEGEEDPLPEETYGGILVFRYLHRPLMPNIRKALQGSGVLIYETFTLDQPRFGKPHNPDFLLTHGELLRWFEDWDIIHHFEGIKEDPPRAIAQIVCRKQE